MLIAEDLLLLLTDDARGTLLVSAQQANVALAGALLVELSLTEHVGVDDRGRLLVSDAGPAGDPLLDSALATVAAKPGKKPNALLGPLSKRLQPALYERLAGQGVLRLEEGRILGVLPTKHWPAQDIGHEEGVRQELTQVLVVGTTPQPRTAALVGLLRALRVLHKVVPAKREGVSRRELDQRAKRIAEGDWASKAVRDAIDAANAAVMAAVIATTVAASGGGAG